MEIKQKENIIFFFKFYEIRENIKSTKRRAKRRRRRRRERFTRVEALGDSWGT